ncbi:MAG TPA: L,D-transpeptidase family protein [Solimonas sp.]|nr:L,D-transpeptidase family protein [Solimonas sp.]
MSKLSMRALAFIVLIGGLAGTSAQAAVDTVRVVKSERKLSLLSGGTVIREFRVALGGNPGGHKQQEGDQRTPEGRYVLDYRKADSGYYKAIHVSYPNVADIERARRRGVAPGGAIMIHGQRNGLAALSAIAQRFDWTDGCIALTDADMETVWMLVRTGTPIEILP